jgi:hypothetical protein
MSKQFTYSIESTDTRIAFPSKPPEAIRALLKSAGFRWSPAGGFWFRRGCKGAADFLTALDRKMNPGRPDGACWRCKAPEGFFRTQGAATPVYCDACHKELIAPAAPDRFDLDFEDRCRETCGL